MSDHGSEPLSEALHRQRVLSRWDNEGGAETDGPQAAADADEGQLPFPRIDDAEFGALHVRVIALENLVIALLAAASDRELDAARNMASYISPRPGFTHHPLTVHAAGHMTNLIDRGYPFPQQGDIGKAVDAGKHGKGSVGAWQRASRSETT